MTTLTTAEKSKPWVTTRRLIAALYVYASWYVLCAVLVLGRAQYLRGESYVPSQGDGYVETSDIWPGALAPLGTLVLITAWLGHLVAGVMVLLAVIWLVDPGVRAERATWTWLLIGTLLVVGTIVLANSDPGEAVRGWILD